MENELNPWLPEDEYNKLVFQTRGQFMAILNCFRCYGLNPYVDQAVAECMKVTENFGMIVRGKQKDVHIMKDLKPKATE